jgi:hypothetical protein
LLQMQQATDSSPVKHPLQAVARALQGAMGGYSGHVAKEEDRAVGAQMFDSLPGIGGGAPPAAPSMAPQPANYGSAIAGIESGGKYDALGPVTKTGDRAYGKYQVMGANVGPWSKQHLGQEMTADQFLQNPQAQDAVFNGQFGSYAQKYGPEGAAKAWFAGERGMNNPNARDQLGTTVQGYADKFNKGMGGSQVAQTMPGAPPQAQSPARQQLNIPPEIAATIKQLGSDPRTRGQAWQLYMQYAKPVESVQPMTPDQRKQWNVPEGVSAGLDQVTGKPVFSQPANSVSVNTAANPLLEGVGKQILDGRKAAQTAVNNSIPAIHQARKALDEGSITGAFAEGRLGLSKIGTLFGIGDPDKVASTEVLRSSLGDDVLSHIKELGANPSNADRDYIERVKGGKIALDETSLRKMLDIKEKYARQTVKNFNRDAKKLMDAPGGTETYKSVAPLLSFEEPGEYAAPEKKAAPTPKGATATNPKTGERVQFDGTSWVPVK